jgi:ClpP class serine protease
MKLFEIDTETFHTFQNDLRQSKDGIDLSEFCNQREDAHIENGIGHVYILGAMMSHAAPIALKLGNTDYADIIRDIETVISQGASSVILNINSGGGTVQGCIEVAEYVQNLPIPIVAYIDGCACSAAYKIACGCTYLVATKSATVGNIGSIVVTTDTLEISKGMGMVHTAFVNEGATLKSAGHLEWLTDDQKKFIQESIDEAGTIFKNHVLSNRPEVDPEVFKAGWYSGQRAIDLGLIDMIGSKQDAIHICENLMAVSFE